MQQNSLHYTRCLEILGQSPLFGGVDDAVLRDMLRIFHYETHAKDETAISPKQALDRLYIIISGRAKVSVYNPDSGREHILFLVGPGYGFDLISLLDGVSGMTPWPQPWMIWGFSLPLSSRQESG